MTKTLLENINAIPPLPESVQEVERVYNNPDSTLEDMQQAIEKDPLLTASILRIVNSPMYGVSRTITNVLQAISLLGKGTVVGSTKDLNPANFNFDKCMRRRYRSLTQDTRLTG